MGYGLDGRGSISDKGKNFLFSTTSRSTLGPTQPPISGVLAAISPGVKRRGVKLTNQFHLVPMSRIVELYLYSSIRLRGIVLN
jgi:hypothetical protein